jgi:hypothetical protein
MGLYFDNRNRSSQKLIQQDQETIQGNCLILPLPAMLCVIAGVP